jgi:hypothetical protein
LVLLSKVRIRGFGSKGVCAVSARRFEDTELSARLSTKSRTIKSLLEKSSRVKLGPLGKRLFGPEAVRSMMLMLTRIEALHVERDHRQSIRVEGNTGMREEAVA